MTFTVPANAASITIIEQIVSAPEVATFTALGTLPNTAVPLRVMDPSGNFVFYRFQAPADPSQVPLYYLPLSPAPGAGTLTLPNTTSGLNLVAAGLPPGTWSFVVSDLAHVCTLASNCAPGGGSATGTYDVTVIVKPGAVESDNIPTHGRVDVTFNLTPAGLSPPLSAATAGSDPDLQRMVAALSLFLGHAGLALGTVIYKDVSPDMAAKVASGVHTDDATICGELHQLFATAPAGRQVNIFLVSTFIGGGAAPGTIVIGMDGTIPGPATISPTLQSGVAVGAADLRSGRSNCGAHLALGCGAERTAYIAAHEMGHFVGLYHVTERTGTIFDPLQDTPTCPCRSCASTPTQCSDAAPPPASPHTMGATECEASPACGGGDNLMFWVVDESVSVGNLTAEQKRVILANPAVY